MTAKGKAIEIGMIVAAFIAWGGLASAQGIGQIPNVGGLGGVISGSQGSGSNTSLGSGGLHLDLRPSPSLSIQQVRPRLAPAQPAPLQGLPQKPGQ